MDKRYTIKMGCADDWQDAMGLSWKTFLEFEGKVYPPSGIRNFNDFITDEKLYQMFLKGEYQMFCAFDTMEKINGRYRLIGLVTLRNISHISLLFVDKKYHRQGIGMGLIDFIRNYLLSEVGCERVTVNAAPYGIPFYHYVGFKDLGPERMSDGILYTPMELFL